MKRRWIAVAGVGIIVLGIFFFFFQSCPQKKLKKDILTKTSEDIRLIKKAEAEYKNGNLREAKRLYTLAKEKITDTKELQTIQKKIEEINIKILFSPIIDECSFKYTVKPGDALVKIAKKYNTTVGLIKKANNLTSDIIRPQDKLKINTCKFSLVIDKSQNLLFLKRNNSVIKEYTVATGKNNSTPSGKFKIVNKLKNPTWYKTGAIIPPDSPKNILGSRWMGFNIKGYGIHGTTDPQTLGQQVTMGCIRMRNSEVEELYNILPIGTEVVIVD